MPNGMKSGSGEDPFADDDPDDRDSEDDVESVVQEGSDDENTRNSGVSNTGLPWKYSRSNAKEGRDMVQFYLQDETKALETDAQSDLEETLGESVLAFDLREAAYQVALEQHLDDVADQLREWGYDAE